MKKLQQAGMIGIVEIIAIILVITVVGFTGYRIGKAQTEVNDITANSKSEDDTNLADSLEAVEKEEDTTQKVEVPKEEEKEIEKETPTEPTKPVEEEKKDYTEPVKEDKPEYINLIISKAYQDGSMVYSESTIASKQTGTCHVKFYKKGQEKVYKKFGITNSASCSTSFLINNFAVSGDWENHVWFVSSDKSIEGYGSSVIATITL